MKDKLQAIEWLMKQTYEMFGDDDLIKCIHIVMKESQTMFSDDDLLGIYLCGTRYCGTDWRKALADYKEFNKQ